MGDASLSQDEIDALLMGGEDIDTGPGGTSIAQAAPAATGGPIDNTAIIAAFNAAMSMASSSAAALVTKNVNISNAIVENADVESLSTEVRQGSVVISIDMGTTKTAFILDENISKKISMLMMGADKEPEVLDEAYLSTLSELANTIVSSISNNLSEKFGDSLTPTVPTVQIYQSPEQLPVFSEEKLSKFTYDLNIEGVPPAKLIHFIDAGAMERWANTSTSGNATAPAGGAELNTGGSSQQPVAPAAQAPMMGMGVAQQPAQHSGGGNVAINPINFPSLSAGGQSAAGQTQIPSNIDLLMDVQMVMTVELGRTKKYVKDILGLGEGSIIELDKLAGEPVDLLVNGKLIAKGEVVVIDENFGVRVTDIVGPAERLARMTGD